MGMDAQALLALWEDFPVDETGRPTHYTSYRVLSRLLEQPHRWYSTRELSELLIIPEYEIEVRMRQLYSVDLVSKSTTESHVWRYNFKCRNAVLQAGLENFMADIEVNATAPLPPP